MIATCFQNRAKELSFLTEEIMTHLNEGLTAILVRTNRMAEQVSEACFRRQIPYQMREKKQDFYAQKCVVEVLSVIRFVAEGRNRSDFMAFMNKPVRYINREMLQKETVDLWALLEECREDPEQYRIIQKLQQDLAMVEMLDPFGAISYIRKVMQYDCCLSPGETGERRRKYSMSFWSGAGNFTAIQHFFPILQRTEVSWSRKATENSLRQIRVTQSGIRCGS